jgi:hypothetical protein
LHNPDCCCQQAFDTAAGIVYVGSKIAEPVAEAVSAVGDAIADGVVIAVDAEAAVIVGTVKTKSSPLLLSIPA